MALEISTLHGFTAAFVGAQNRVATTHRPVVGCHIFVTCVIVFTVFAAEELLQTLVILMDPYTGTLKRPRAVKAFDFSELTAL